MKNENPYFKEKMYWRIFMTPFAYIIMIIKLIEFIPLYVIANINNYNEKFYVDK